MLGTQTVSAFFCFVVVFARLSVDIALFELCLYHSVGERGHNKLNEPCLIMHTHFSWSLETYGAASWYPPHT